VFRGQRLFATFVFKAGVKPIQGLPAGLTNSESHSLYHVSHTLSKVNTTKDLNRRRNDQIFHTVMKIYNVVTEIPSQVERQQPVYFIDALGKHSPFFLEFVQSAEVIFQDEGRE
jgi:hypothetical protein